MARIIVLSSQVVRGHVGLSAAVPALQALGHEVWPLPTIVLSNHPAHAHVAGTPTAVEQLEQMLDALAANGWLGEVDAVLTGYLPSVQHVAFAARMIARLRGLRPQGFVLCDPVLGDDPKGLYLEAAAAAAIRDTLLPLADIVTPNRFELAWLTGRRIDDLDQAVAAAERLSPATVLVTSAARRANEIVTLLHTPRQVLVAAAPIRPAAPHGTGDLFSGLLLGHLLNGLDDGEAMGRAVSAVSIAIDASAGRDELALAAILPRLVATTAAPVTRRG